MRKLLTPISVVGIGLLAAMPFRKQPTTIDSAFVAPNDTAFGQQRPSEFLATTFPQQNLNRIEGPRSVVPLREEPVVEQPHWLVALEQQAQRSEPAPAAENPYELVIRELPTSYDDIAIPLSPETHAGNLLVAEQQTTLSPDHFGIPREVSTAPALTAITDDRVDPSATLAHGIAAQSAKFQPVRMQELSSDTAISAGNAGIAVATDMPVDETATSSEPQETQVTTPRQRHFIRVPRP